MPPRNIEHFKCFLLSPLTNQSVYEGSKVCRAEKTESDFCIFILRIFTQLLSSPGSVCRVWNVDASAWLRLDPCSGGSCQMLGCCWLRLQQTGRGARGQQTDWYPKCQGCCGYTWCWCSVVGGSSSLHHEALTWHSGTVSLHHSQDNV